MLSLPNIKEQAQCLWPAYIYTSKSSEDFTVGKIGVLVLVLRLMGKFHAREQVTEKNNNPPLTQVSVVSTWEAK